MNDSADGAGDAGRLVDEAHRIAKLGMCEWDVAGGCVTWSREAHRLYASTARHHASHGSGPVARIRPAFFRAVLREDRGAVRRALDAALQAGGAFSTDHRLAREPSRVVQVRGEVVRDPSGAPARLVATAQDVTESREREASLERARAEAEARSRATGEFLANMSHEIRTPMNGVLGMTELLQSTRLDPEQRDYVETISRCGQSLITILNDVLDLTRVEARKLRLESIPFDLTALVFDVVELHRAKAAGTGVDLLVDQDPSGPARLVGDPTRLRQVLGNLVSNAVKFTAAGHVLVTTCLRDDEDGRSRVRIAVADTGIGIPVEAQGRLFQPFSQADAATARRFGGSGLGLLLCKRIVERMGGTIELESEPGVGSTFTISLRLAKDDQPAPALPPPSILRGARVLVLDDDPVDREILAKHLVDAGARAELAASSIQALEALRLARDAGPGSRLDAAILGHELPDSGGDELAAVLRKDPVLGGVGLLMLSASGQPGEAALAQRFGFDGYLVKPLRAEILVNALAMVIARRRRGETGPLITRHTVSEAGPALEERPVLARPLRVLLVEDNLVNQKVAGKMLEEMGARPQVAGDGAQALDALEGGAFDVVLMDCQMPGMDGFAATRGLRDRERARGGHVPVVAMTANALAGDRERCLAAGMDDYVTKPITRRALWEALSRWGAGVATAAEDEAGRRDAAPSGGDARRDAAPPSVDGTRAEDAGAALELDASRLEEMRGLFATSPGGLHEQVLAPFVAKARAQVNDLGRALQAADWASVRILAHTLKGASRNLGFVGMSDRAERLETGASGDGVDDGLLATLEDELRRVTLFVQRDAEARQATSEAHAGFGI